MAFFTSDEVEALSSQPIRVALLVELNFDDETMGVWNGFDELTVNGVEYKPLFGAGRVDGLSFENATRSDKVTVSLSGVTDTAIGLALEDAGEVQDRLMRIYLQFFDDYWQPVAAAPCVFFGFMQPPEITETEIEFDGESQKVRTIEVAAENVFFNRTKPVGGRFTDRDQQIRHPGDKFFQFVAPVVFKTFTYPDY